MQTLRDRMGRREANFLCTLSSGILSNPANASCQLLAHAGIGLDDIRQSLSAHGLETTLRDLRRSGVYLTVEEFKGEVPIVRDGHTLAARHTVENPGGTQHFRARTGGSRAPRLVRLSFEYLEAAGINNTLTLIANGVFDAPAIHWLPAPPAPSGLLAALGGARMGRQHLRWFSHTRPTTVSLFAATYGTLFLARLFGRRAPWPELAPLSHAYRVAEAIWRTVSRYGQCNVGTYVSSAVYVCQAALRRGLSLAGATFLVSGEPMTEERRCLIESTGAVARGTYWVTELGLVASACSHCLGHHDEMHVWEDTVAVIQDESGNGDAPQTLCFTPLLPSTPVSVLNLDVGDAGRLYRRACSCPLGDAGMTLTVADVHSTRRITAGGMTLTAHQLAELVERDLPERFGGHAGDYQVVEEASGSHTRILLLAAPRLGPLDEAALKAAVHEYLRGKHALMGAVIAQAGIVEVRREAPHATVGGKVHPVLVKRAGGV
jgi:hypothetical protein